MRRSLPLRLTALSAVVAIGIGALSGYSQSVPATAQQYEGLVKPSRRVVLKAPVAGRVAAMPVEEAQAVQAGTVLVQMDDRVQRSTLELARLRAEDDTAARFAQLALEEAQLRLSRLEEMLAADAANAQEVQHARVLRDQAEVKVEAAKREQQQAQVRLELERRRLEQFVVEAPFDGWVAKTHTEPGASLTTEEPVLELVALDPLEAELYLPSTAYGRLEIGRTYPLEAGAPVNRTLRARLDRVVPMIDPGSRMFRAVFVIDNPDAGLPSGFTVHLSAEAAVAQVQ